MRYIDRRFLFPVAAATAWAQQPSPATAEAEAALRARVDDYYKLQVEKKYRQAESMVAEDSKDDYYNHAKQDIKGFSIQQLELTDDNTRARVTVKGKVLLRAALIGAQEFEIPLTTYWKLENGQWVWYINREVVGQTPFGRVSLSNTDTPKGGVALPTGRIDAATLMNQVTVDRTSVTLSTASPEATVVVTNNLPGPITLEMNKPQLSDIAVNLEKSELKGGEKVAVRFRLTGSAGSSGVVHLIAYPLNKLLTIQVSSK